MLRPGGAMPSSAAWSVALCASILLPSTLAVAEPEYGGQQEVYVGIEPYPRSEVFATRDVSLADDYLTYWPGPALRAGWRRRLVGPLSLEIGETVTLNPHAFYYSDLRLLFASTTALAEAALAVGRVELGLGAGGGVSVHIADTNDNGWRCQHGCIEPGVNVFVALRLSAWVSSKDAVDLTWRAGHVFSRMYLETHAVDLGISWRHAL